MQRSSPISQVIGFENQLDGFKLDSNLQLLEEVRDLRYRLFPGC
jgi:hypothetical protein